MNRIRLAIVVLALAGLADSVYLTVLKVQLMQQGLSCGFGGCDFVNASEYSVLLGVPVALWGAITYAGIVGLTLFWYDASGSTARWLGLAILAIAAWGTAFSAYLTLVELFVIHAICPFCVISATIITLILILAVLAVWRQSRTGESASPGQ